MQRMKKITGLIFLFAALNLTTAGLCLAQEAVMPTTEPGQDAPVSAPIAMATSGQLEAEKQVPSENLAAHGEVVAPGKSGIPMAKDSLYGLGFLKAIGAFLLVLLLMFLALKGLGRLGRFRHLKGNKSTFKLRGTLALDARKYLAAVEIDGRLIVVGVSQDKINAVAHWPLYQDDEVPFSLENSSLVDDGTEKDLDLDLADIDTAGERSK